MEGIIRNPTEMDKSYIGEDGKIDKFISGERKTVKEQFEQDLAKELQKVLKSNTGLTIEKKKPFAEQVARTEFMEHWTDQRDKALRERGKIEASDFTAPKIDWKKYSNMDNFEQLDEGERLDEHLTEINPGLHVMSKWIKYKFKGFFGTYKVMEDGPEAIKRAKHKSVTETEEIKKAIK